MNQRDCGPAGARTAERRSGVASETVLPEQYFSARLHGAEQHPEKRLMLAVLESAIAEFHCRVIARIPVRSGADDARLWIGSDDVEWPFAFVNICHALGLEPDAVRGALFRWSEAVRARPDDRPVLARAPFRRVGGSRTKPTQWKSCA